MNVIKVETQLYDSENLEICLYVRVDFKSFEKTFLFLIWLWSARREEKKGMVKVHISLN